MSFSFRDKPKLSDRYRGKSSDEILNELKNKLDEDMKTFFESSPGWDPVQPAGSFSRAGHPLDDKMSRGHQGIRSHLDDLAQRHPEFAEHLRCPPWGGEMSARSHGTWGRKRRGSGSSGDDLSAPESMSQQNQHPEESNLSRGRSRQNNLPQYGLRNTVDLGQQHQQQEQQQQFEDQEIGRGQRSWSAPPDNRTRNPDPPRFVSRLDIPINATLNCANPDQGKPPVAPKQSQPYNVQNQQPRQNIKKNQQGSNVRHIPIFVEGRDEPLLPKAATDILTEKIFNEKVSHQPTFNYGRPSQFTAHQNQQQEHPSTHMPAPASFNQNVAPSEAKPFAQQQQCKPPCHPTPQQEEVLLNATSQPAKQPPIICNAISRVQAVEKNVDELKLKVDEFSGNSRKDKEYLYLDEMLTRCLVTLDNIETEGKEDVRQARKTVIHDIQQCISILETKVPSSDEIFQNSIEGVAKLVEVSKNPSNLAGLNSVKFEDKTVTSREVVACKEKKMCQGNEEQKMEVVNLPTAVEVKVESQPGVEDSVYEVIEAEPNNYLNKGSTEEVECEFSNKEVANEQTLKQNNTNLLQVSAELVDFTSVKSEDILNEDGDRKLEKTGMQVNEITQKDELPQEEIKIDNLCNENLKFDSVEGHERNEKPTNLSPKNERAVLNTSKSPKGSSKKGKCSC